MKRWLEQLQAVLWKEALIEWRTRAAFGAMAVFAVLTLFLFHFAFPPERRDMAYLAPGVLWMSFLFSLLLGLNRTMAREKDNGCLEAQLLAPLDRTALFAGKLLANLALLVLLQTLMLATFMLFFHVEFTGILAETALSFSLGALGMVTVGTLFSAMAIHTRLAEVLLSLLVVPLCLPVLIGGVKATAALLIGDLEAFGFWRDLLIGCDALYLILGATLFGAVVDEA